MSRISGEPDQGVQAAALTLRLIELLARERRPVGVTALAQALGTTKSRIYRHLQTLVQSGYLGQESDTDRYHVGARLISLARAVGDNLDLVGIAMPVLQDLRDTLGHYTVISEIESDGVRVLAAISGRSLVEIGVKRGSLLHFHSSAQGKVALAFGPPDLRSRILRSRLEMFTPKTLTSPKALDRELDRIAARGWSAGYNEALLGLNALAAPIFDATGQIVATVGIVDSIQFIEESPSDDQIKQTTLAGRRISALLGHNGPTEAAPSESMRLTRRR